MISAVLALWLACTLALAPVALAHCPACALRSEIRHISLEAIKREILAKLGMERAPNMTGRQVPNIAPLTTLFDVQTDQVFRQPVQDEPDESSATTERVIAFAQPRQYFYLFLILSPIAPSVHYLNNHTYEPIALIRNMNYN